MHESLLARAIRNAGGAQALAQQIGPEGLALLLRTWGAVARPKQLVDLDAARTVLWLAGRGWGKTGCLTGYLHQLVDSGRYGRIALVGPTAADVRDVLVEGESGLLQWSPPGRDRPHYEPSKRKVTFWNGAMATLFSAEEPERLRGPQFHAAICDEIAAWRYPEDAWQQVKMVTRLPGAGTRRAIATTPRPTALIKALVADPLVLVRKGTTFENASNLDPDFIKEMRELAKTRVGRQEINAEILDDNPAALWSQRTIDGSRVSRDLDDVNRLLLGSTAVADMEDLVRVVVAVDPAVTSNEDSDETGIVVVGLGPCRCKGPVENHGFVLDDVSAIMPAPKWAARVAAAYQHWGADKVLAEVNNGGDLVAVNLRAHGNRDLPYKSIHASRGKRLRHEPVSTLYEQGKVHHVGVHAKLEDQMIQWDPLTADSPDRLDALTIGITELLLGEGGRMPGRMGITVIGRRRAS